VTRASPVANPGAPPEARTLPGVLLEKAELAPRRPALIYGDRTLSYGELAERSLAVAKALMAAGVEPGDCVAALLGNEPDWLVVQMAAHLAGAALAPLNTWYKADELAWTLRHCRVKALVSAPAFLKADYVALFGALIPELSGVGEDGQVRAAAFPHLRAVIFTHAWDTFLRRGDSVRSAPPGTRPDAAAFILYTSGSTAEPKGVLLNHRSLVENGWDMGARRGIEAEDRVWLASPLFYGLGAANALPAALTHGASLVLQGAFEAGAAIDTVRRTGATVYYGTGNMTRAMLDHPDYTSAKVGSLQKGNAGTVAEYKRMTLVEMGIKGAVPAYGLTESYGNATVGEVDDELEVKIATSGKLLPGMDMRIVDPETGTDLAPGEVGLVLLRGHVTSGYLHSPPEASQSLRADGWFDTGDLGALDGDGRFRFHARLKEVIKSGGVNVSPVEVEQLLASHPAVRDAFVVGAPHPVKGELVVAFVDRSRDVSEDELRKHVKDRAAAFKTPHHVVFVDEADLPRLASGKVAKHKLVEQARVAFGGKAAP